MISHPLQIDVHNHLIPGIQGPTDIEGAIALLGPVEFKRTFEGIERLYFPQAVVDVSQSTGMMELIDFTPDAPIFVFGLDPFRDPSVLAQLCNLSKDWEQKSPMGDHYFYDLKVGIYFDSSGDLSDSSFGFFWSNMPTRNSSLSNE